MKKCKITPHFWVLGLPPIEESVPNAIYFVKNGLEIDMYTTDRDGNPFKVSGGSISSQISLNSPDNSVTIVGSNNSFSLSISNNLKNLINSALQPGNNISLLNNNAGYLTNSSLTSINTSIVNLQNNKFDKPTGDPSYYLNGIGVPTQFPSVIIQITKTSQIINDGENGTSRYVEQTELPNFSSFATISYVNTQDALKVDKISGKGLSTEDYTTVEKNKLSGIEAGAQVNVVPDWLDITNKPTTFPPSSHTHTISDVINLQTSLDSKQSQITLTTTGTGAATFTGNTLNIPTPPTYPVVTPAALTKTDDTNVTLTLSGIPSTALLQNVNLTLGWTGTLSDSRIASSSIWNAKQNALSGTGIVKSTAGTISYITDNSSNWDNAYSNRISSLTTTGNSGASTLVSNVLNIPNYTLSGLGGQPQLSGTGFVKISGTTISYDNSSYLTSNQTITLTGDITGSGSTTITTSYNNVVPSNKGGAGTISGILKANGSGVVSQAVLGTDYINANQSISFTPNAGGDVTGNSSGTTSLTPNLVIGAAKVTNTHIATGIDAIKIGTGVVDNTEFGYLDGVTSSIQTQLNGKVSQGGNTFGTTLVIGTNDLQETNFRINGLTRAALNAGGLAIVGGFALSNYTNATHFTLNVGTAVASPTWTRSVTGATAVAQFINNSAASTGNIIEALNMTSVVSGTRKDGRVFGSDATATNDFITLSQLNLVNPLNRSGQSTQSGTGSATSFTITHGLSGINTTNKAFVTPRTAASANIQYIDISSTAITIFYSVAPTTGTNNLKWDWQII